MLIKLLAVSGYNKLKEYRKILAFAGIVAMFGAVGCTTQTGNTTPTLTAAKIIKTAAYKLKITENRVSVIFSDSIEPAESYTDLALLVATLDSNKTVDVYLKGNGGSVDGLLVLSSAFQHTKAKVNMIVYGNVYSAHAMLALQGDTLTAYNPHIMFLFHRPAAYDPMGNALLPGAECDRLTTIDRGIPSKLKCMLFNQAYEAEVNSIVMEKIYLKLTPEQLASYQQGHDVLVEARQLM